ncbi:MAG: hypothetical protein ABEJ25_04085 [Candidatus Bipolaricaulia bacterium]
MKGDLILSICLGPLPGCLDFPYVQYYEDKSVAGGAGKGRITG